MSHEEIDKIWSKLATHDTDIAVLMRDVLEIKDDIKEMKATWNDHLKQKIEEANRVRDRRVNLYLGLIGVGVAIVMYVFEVLI